MLPRITRYLALAAGLLLGVSARAQGPSIVGPDSAATLRRLQRHYSAALGYESRLYNGPEYVSYVKRYIVGHPFFESTQPRAATIEYAGSTYANVPLFYDIVLDELVLGAPQGTLEMRLIKDKVQRFVVAGHSFVHLRAGADSAQGPPARPGFYEVLVEGPVQLLALRHKNLQERASAGQLEGEITERDEFFVYAGRRYAKASSASEVLAALPTQKAALRKYIRTEKLKFGAAYREKSLVALARYAATLAPAAGQ
ncbi:hypothetical protein [Hymenobacter chitinivorans]|uniref:DUF4468 domain-containing protein n=1 Tax=Hymenobacter chitinivorans DSM 11115 TaxID=1121954 RepID=A0A2M9B4W5_9BACT|nr:hypothetical protein [Hymenobacter chitinivorans]PJJ52984.1 hypothetical protein CLV45_3642 [Hymenobacter chitinivorans DSM 11115]